MWLREARCTIDKSENSYAINRGWSGCPCEFFVFMAGEDAASGMRNVARREKGDEDR